MRTARRLAAVLVGVALLAPAGIAGAATAPDGPLAETEDVGELLGVDPAAGVPGLDWPNRRFAPCSAYDARGGRWIVIGGRATDEVTHYRDAWALELPRDRQSRWRLLAGADAQGAPPPLRSCSAVYDPVGRRVLVFGGWDGVRQYGEVWALSLGDTPEWSTVCAADGCGGGPGPRRAAQAVLDGTRERLVLFGGTDGTYRDDLWELSLRGEPAWRRVSVGATPPARAGHAMTVAGSATAWLFGGSAKGAERNDLWSLDLATLTWTEVMPDGCGPPCPAPRGGATLVADPRNDRLVLFGGHEAASATYPEGVDLLSGLSAAPRWAPARLDSAELQPRAFHAAAYDPRGERMLVFGGGFGTGTFKDTAALALPADGSAPSWHATPPVTGVTARDQAAVHLDPASSSLYAFGGFGSGGLPSHNTGGVHLADVLRLPLPRPSQRGATGLTPGRAWRNATPLDGATVPLHREASATASDFGGRRLFVVGGLQGDRSLADVWVADFGMGGDGGPRHEDSSAARGRPAWRQLCTASSCGPGPAARWGGHAVYDAAQDRLVVYGGRQSGGATFGDVWALSLGATPRWTALAPQGAAPPPRWGGAVAYDAARRRMVVWGGQAGTDAAATLDADAWALALDGPPAWTRLAPEGSPPAPRRSMAFATRSAGGADELLVFGGYGPSGSRHRNDVARLRLDSEQGRWETLSPGDCAARTGPTCRRSSSAAYDPRGDRLLVVFGRDGESLFGDSYAFALSTATWTPLAPAPPAG